MLEGTVVVTVFTRRPQDCVAVEYKVIIYSIQETE